MRKHRFPFLVKVALGTPLLLVALYVAVCLVFFILRYHLNHRKVPSDLVEPPREITRMIQPPSRHAGYTLSVPMRHVSDPQTSAPLASYVEKMDFLSYRLILDKDNPGSTLLLQIKSKLDPLRKEIESNIFPSGSDNYTLYGEKSTPWDSAGDMVTTEQARWLKGHHDLLTLIEEYCKTDGPTPLTPEECKQLEKSYPLVYGAIYYEGFLGQKSSLLEICSRLVSGEGKWDLQQGDQHGAQQSFQALIKLRLATGVDRFKQWIETEAQPIPYPQELTNLLDTVKQDRMTRGAYIQPMIEKYLYGRYYGLRELERPYKPEEWGYYKQQLYFFDAGPVKLPRGLSFMLMYRMMRMPCRLKAFDEQWEKGLAVMQLPWPQVPNETLVEHYSAYDDPYGPEMSQTFRKRLQSFLMFETQLNLVRAALEGRQNHQFKIPDQDFDFKNDPNNRWRDPFTERPFHVIESTTGTMIYSLGPDMKDQQGKPFDKREQEKTGYADEHYDIGIFVPRVQSAKEKAEKM